MCPCISCRCATAGLLGVFTSLNRPQPVVVVSRPGQSSRRTVRWRQQAEMKNEPKEPESTPNTHGRSQMRQNVQRQRRQVEPQAMAPTANTTCSRWLSQVNTPMACPAVSANRLRSALLASKQWHPAHLASVAIPVQPDKVEVSGRQQACMPVVGNTTVSRVVSLGQAARYAEAKLFGKCRSRRYLRRVAALCSKTEI